jgi:hypothetical protein
MSIGPDFTKKVVDALAKGLGTGVLGTGVGPR